MPRSDRPFLARTIAPALLMAALLGACSDIYYDRREGVSFQAGNAVASNVAVDVDPWPTAAANRKIAGNGQLVQGAIERYRTNKVVPPQGTGTSSVKYAPSLAPQAASGGAPNP
ncbi:MAG: hypothetical protein E6I47_15860 [Chloroflexi bacterium]|nr:MAG: hypothetical protein E6I47_15860 [Chloroflexota bacterium]